MSHNPSLLINPVNGLCPWWVFAPLSCLDSTGYWNICFNLFMAICLSSSHLILLCSLVTSTWPHVVPLRLQTRLNPEKRSMMLGMYSLRMCVLPQALHNVLLGTWWWWTASFGGFNCFTCWRHNLKWRDDLKEVKKNHNQQTKQTQQTVTKSQMGWSGHRCKTDKHLLGLDEQGKGVHEKSTIFVWE